LEIASLLPRPKRTSAATIEGWIRLAHNIKYEKTKAGITAGRAQQEAIAEVVAQAASKGVQLRPKSLTDAFRRSDRKPKTAITKACGQITIADPRDVGLFSF
jgi:hypothetical protein